MLTEKEWEVLVLRHQGLLQHEIAKRLGVTQASVSRVETNARAKILAARRDLATLDELGLAVPQPRRPSLASAPRPRTSKR